MPRAVSLVAISIAVSLALSLVATFVTRAIISRADGSLEEAIP